MKTAYIIGAGGHGRVVRSIIHELYDKIVFVDAVPAGPEILEEEAVFGAIDSYRAADFYLGIGSNTNRKKVFHRLKEHGITPATCISPGASVAFDAVIGDGVVVCAGSVVGSNARLHDNTIVNTLSSVDHDCVLGAHSQVTAGVTLAGAVSVGESCFFGVKSCTVPGVTIGNGSVIMAGSVVYKDVADRVMVGGNPARIVKKLDN